MEDRFSCWRDIQSRIAHCGECCKKFPNDVICPLSTLAIPNPPEMVNILFVGVAPTRQDGRSKGTHFYSSPQDQLRRELFRLLGKEPFLLPVAGHKDEDNVRAFHESKCFFVHAAKVRPIAINAPPKEVISFCAVRHLLEEIQFIRPQAVCILSKTKVGPVTAAIFGRPISEDPLIVTVGDWTGLVVTAPQPVRGGASRTKEVITKLWQLSQTNESTARTAL